MPSTNADDILDGFQEGYENRNSEPFSLRDFLELCRKEPEAGTLKPYASPSERLLKAIGEPKVVDTSRDARLSRIYQNKVIKVYPAFEGFYGVDNAIQKIVDHLTHASQGLEARKQILYLLGPVGGGKSSLADRLKSLSQKEPFYALVAPDGTRSPINENPLGLFVGGHADDKLAKLQAPKDKGGFGIAPRYFPDSMSPWAAKRLKEVGGDITKFSVVKVYPSLVNQIALSSTEPGDDNNQDISTLVGKIDIRKMEQYSQNDPDAYSWDGGLCTANRGILEFVEMFKAPIKVLNPLLAATQDRRFQGTEKIGAIPFDGIILAHSNESEWKAFSQNKRNEAFLDRVNIIKVPYCLQKNEEVLILKKLIDNSDLIDKPCAPGTLEMMAEYSVLSRLKEHENSELPSKLRVYNGENIKETDPKAKSIQEYKDAAGVDEGMAGSSTRFAYKVLSETFNFHAQGKAEIAANPIHLMYVLEESIKQLQSPDEEKLLGFVNKLKKDYVKAVGNEIQTAYIESYAEYGQNIFDRYIQYADFWIQDQEYRDPDTGEVLDRKLLTAELEKIEKPAGVANPKDFRNEVVNFVLRERAKNGGKNPEWTSYEKLKSVIEKKMFTGTEEMLPVIQFGAKSSGDMEKKHNNYVDNMAKRGYTPQQVRLVTDWWLKCRVS
jgi:serine protein kinase